jgi:hypothetical protein
MKRLALAIFIFGLFLNAYAFDLDCVASYSGIPEQYPGLVCGGDRLMNEGEFSAAEKKYSEAASLDFFEMPNFEIYLRIARAQCSGRRISTCKKTLTNFEQMLDIY